MANNQIIRKCMDELQSQVAADKEWWDKRKATIQSDFMKELDDDDAKVKEVAAAAKAERKSSDDDAVLVESGGPAASTPAGSLKGKKKAKK
jgi:translocation protein SEC66